jgi:hypothetical protein
VDSDAFKNPTVVAGYQFQEMKRLLRDFRPVSDCGSRVAGIWFTTAADAALALDLAGEFLIGRTSDGHTCLIGIAWQELEH